MRVLFLLVALPHSYAQATSLFDVSTPIKRHEAPRGISEDLNLRKTNDSALAKSDRVLGDHEVDHHWEYYSPQSFFNSEGNKFFLWSHSILAVVAYALMAPVSLMTSSDSRTEWLHVRVQTVQSGLVLLSIACFGLYCTTAADIYPGNSYASFSIPIVILESARWVAVMMRAAMTLQFPQTCSSDIGTNIPMEDVAQEIEPTVSSFGPRETLGGSRIQQSKFIRRLAGSKLLFKINLHLGGLVCLLHGVLRYAMFLIGYIYLLTGLATAFLMGQGDQNDLLAQIIKGLVVCVLGFVEFSRYLGAGASRGWGWNEVYVYRESETSISHYIWPKRPTAEFVQSFLIFAIGVINVFSRARSHDGSMPVAFIFIGGGLCGTLLESTWMKSLVESSSGVVTEPKQFARRSWSQNPMPAVVILWTSALSTQTLDTPATTISWNMLFCGAAIFRIVTLLMLVSKPRPGKISVAEQPMRPFSEVLVCFLLICGGMAYMASNHETVEGMMYRGIGQQLVLNEIASAAVCMMAYFIVCYAFKGWARR